MGTGQILNLKRCALGSSRRPASFGVPKMAHLELPLARRRTNCCAREAGDPHSRIVTSEINRGKGWEDIR